MPVLNLTKDGVRHVVTALALLMGDLAEQIAEQNGTPSDDPDRRRGLEQQQSLRVIAKEFDARALLSTALDANVLLDPTKAPPTAPPTCTLVGDQIGVAATSCALLMALMSGDKAEAMEVMQIAHKKITPTELTVTVSLLSTAMDDLIAHEENTA